jgi:hypothetical protein
MTSLAEQLLRQSFQPFEPEKFSIPISSRLTLDVHSSTKPHNLKIANLQKGLILNCDGKERIAEGAGFGFPVVVGPEETVFSGSANVTLSRTSSSAIVIRKVFRMDRIARNRLGNVLLENRQARAFVSYLCDFYQKNRHLRSLWSRKLLLKIGVEVAFEETESVGNVPVIYQIDRNTVSVHVDFSHVLHKDRKRVFVLNEQSASFFRRYNDSQDTELVDGQIGAWDNVHAESAWFTDAPGRFGFRLWKAEKAILRRGRETMGDFLDWAGLDYELNPNVDSFGYKIELLDAKSTW